MSGTILVNRYKIQEPLGSGSYGSVYRGFDKKTRDAVAVKLENKCDPRLNNFKQEVAVYTALRGAPGFPKLHWKGRSSTGRQALVLDLLGPDLGQLLQRHASLKTTLMIALQLLTRLECIHQYGYIHNDLKLENIAIGCKHLQNVVFLLDFGLSVQHLFRGMPTRQRANDGTHLFSAIGTHKKDAGREISCPQHDLESLGYLIIFLLMGRLPWDDLCSARKEDETAIMKMKIAHRATLCDGMAEEIQHYMKYVHALDCGKTVDYDHLRDLLLQLLHRSGLQNDCVFDWTTSSMIVPVSLSPIPITQVAPPGQARVTVLPRLDANCVQSVVPTDDTSTEDTRRVQLPSGVLRRCVSARRLLKDNLARATELNRAALLVRSQSASAVVEQG